MIEGDNFQLVLFMHRLDLDSVMNITDIPSVVLTDAMEEEEILQILEIVRESKAYLENLSTSRTQFCQNLRRNVLRKISRPSLQKASWNSQEVLS